MVKFELLNNFSLDTLIIPLIKKDDTQIPDELLDGIQFLDVVKKLKGLPGETKTIYLSGRSNNLKVILVDLGEKITAESVRRAFGAVGNKLRKEKVSKVGIIFSKDVGHYESYFEGIFLGNYRFLSYKTKEENQSIALEELIAICPAEEQEAILQAESYAKATVTGTNLARDLGNTPSNDATPAYLAEQASKLQELGLGLKVTILDTEDIKKENMGLFLAVAQGSLETEPPKFIIMEYNPEGTVEKTLCLVGKGITFDTGGITLKPGNGMGTMKFDMCGAAVVIGSMQTIAMLKPKHIRVIGLVPATPNVLDAKAYRPGDIITTRAGITVEIISTDAEGRNILSDALDYAKEFNPDLVFDFATLTGSKMIALGSLYAAYYLNQKAQELKGLSSSIYQIGRKTGDYCWQMPLDEEYFEYLKSSYADFKHTGGRAGGSIIAAMFLSQFTTSYPWVHFDIAGSASRKDIPKLGNDRYYNSTIGGTGFGIRFVSEFVRSWIRLEK